MRRIAAITMVRDDDFFLQKWVDYYGKEIGFENLFVFFDGLDQMIPAFCDDIYTEKVEKIGNTVISSDKGRSRFISEKAKNLLKSGYQMVIGTDADEYLVVDPKEGKNLNQFLSNLADKPCISGLGLDFGQKSSEKKSLSLDKPFLKQRHYAQISSRYTKTSVLTKPLVWGSGFHRVKGHNYYIVPNLYLMHFGYSDLRIIQSRINNIDRVIQGWLKHIVRRSKTIKYVNSKKIYAFEKAVKIARICETILRPPFAWNKPALLWQKIIIKIPERFENLL